MASRFRDKLTRIATIPMENDTELSDGELDRMIIGEQVTQVPDRYSVRVQQRASSSEASSPVEERPHSRLGLVARFHPGRVTVVG